MNLRKALDLVNQGKTIYEVYGYAYKEGEGIDTLLPKGHTRAYYLSFSHAKRLMENKAREWFEKDFSYDLYIRRLIKNDRSPYDVVSKIDWVNSLD